MKEQIERPLDLSIEGKGVSCPPMDNQLETWCLQIGRLPPGRNGTDALRLTAAHGQAWCTTVFFTKYLTYSRTFPMKLAGARYGVGMLAINFHDYKKLVTGSVCLGL